MGLARFVPAMDRAQRPIRRIVFRLMPRRAAEILATAFGLWCTVLPLALWVAWTGEMFLYILASGAVSCFCFAVLGIATAPARRTPQDLAERRRSLDDLARLRAARGRTTWRDTA